MSSKFTPQSKIPDMNSRGDYQQTIPVEGDVLAPAHDQLPPSYEEAAGSSSNSHPASAGTPPDQAGGSPRARTMSSSSSACRSRCGGSIQKPQDAITQGYQPQGPMSAYQDDDAKWDAKLGEPGCCFSESGACCFSKRGACCFSDRGACCFSDREACCFSDRKGCCFSDQGGCCNGNSRGSMGTCC